MLDHDGLNFPVFRYADVLLMYAEALNEWKGGPTQEAYDAINEIRERAGVDEIEELDYKLLSVTNVPVNYAMRGIADSILCVGEYL